MGSFYVQNSGTSTADQNIWQFESFHKQTIKKYHNKTDFGAVVCLQLRLLQTDTNCQNLTVCRLHMCLSQRIHRLLINM